MRLLKTNNSGLILRAREKKVERMGRPRRGRRLRICLVSSVGGHFRELLQLRRLYAAHGHFYVLNDRMESPGGLAARMIRITHAERGWKQLLNFFEAGRILRRLRPDLIVTTGASPAVVFGILARWFRIPMVFVEGSYAVQRPTLSGWLVYHLRLAELFLYQWPTLKKCYPRGTYAGLIY